MRFAGLGLAAVLAAAMADAAVGQTSQVGQSPWKRPTHSDLKPIATRQYVFSIPFQVNQPNRPEEQPVEVHLYVSSDAGANWRLYDRRRPSAGKFDFRAGGDGRYWFMVRTLDRFGRIHPTGPAEPELAVAVDTVAPTMTLDASVDAEGHVKAAWRISDPLLVSDSFRLQYQDGPGDSWQSVTFDPPPTDQPQGTVSGEVTWRPKSSDTTINIRAEVRDRAGNSAVANRRLDMPQVAARPNTAAEASPVQPPSGRPYPRTSYEAIQPPAGAVSDASGSDLPRPDEEGGITWPADRITKSPLGHEPRRDPSPPSAAAPDPRSPVAHQAAARLGGQRKMTHEHPSPETPARPDPGYGVDHRLTNTDPRDRMHGADQADGNRVLTKSAIDTPAVGQPDFSILPAGERPRMTNLRRLNLEYDVETIGASGVGRVELWITCDGGRTWTSGGIDDDNQNPFPVELPGEGIFGLRLVVHSGNGLAARRPQPGDMPEIWVGVDQTKPAARITSAVYGTGSRAGELAIHWLADDARLGDRPVNLSFSATPGGPWSPIASGLPNTGQYRWRVDGRVPAQIYLRLQVRDEAGNIAVYKLERPIANDGLVPRGRIRGIHPAAK